MFANSDYSELLRIFNARNVKYLVIGGYALMQLSAVGSLRSPLHSQMRHHRRRE